MVRELGVEEGTLHVGLDSCDVVPCGVAGDEDGENIDLVLFRYSSFLPSAHSPSRRERKARTDGVHDETHLVELLRTDVRAIRESKLLPISTSLRSPPL